MAQLTKRGLIAAVVCSDTFMKLGTAQAKVFGVPDLPLLKIQHPLGGLNMDKVKERATVALPQLLSVVKDKQQDKQQDKPQEQQK